jgi:hypothetical protein
MIIADLFGLVSGDDHPYITRSARPDTKYQHELVIIATVIDIWNSVRRARRPHRDRIDRGKGLKRQ